MYTIIRSRRFDRSFGKLQHSGRLSNAVESHFKIVITSLRSGERLAAEYRDHALQGDFAPYRECHIRGDVLLLYQKNEESHVVLLVDIGTHASLFGE